MDETIGIILSHKEWKKILRKDELKPEYRKMVSIIHSFNLNVIFFSIQTIDMISKQGRGIHFFHRKKDQGLLPLPVVLYIPRRLYNKNDLMIMRMMIKEKEFHVINEHHSIKNVEQLLRSQEHLSKLGLQYKDDYEDQHERPMSLYVLGQYEKMSNWTLTVKYGKIDDELVTLENMQKRLKQVHQSWILLIDQICFTALDVIQKFYPGIHEVGLVFDVDENGTITFKRVEQRKKILSDLYEWNSLLWERVIKLPIQAAAYLIYELKKQYPPYIEANDLIPAKPLPTNKQPSHWIRFELTNENYNILELPIGSSSSNPHVTNVQFGLKKVNTTVYLMEETDTMGSYELPKTAYISKRLAANLALSTSKVYQVFINGDTVVIGPIIGLLLGENNHHYTADYMEKYSDRFGNYEQYGGLIIGFSTRSIDWRKKIAYGYVYDHETKTWEYGTSPIPTVIYRRNFHQSQVKMNHLSRLTNGNLFNSYRFTKKDLLYMQDEEGLKDHLPETHLLEDVEKLILFLENKNKVILKPKDLSRGRGIFLLEKHEETGFILTDWRKSSKIQHHLLDQESLAEMINSLNVPRGKYLFQAYIPLLKVNGNPFDIRIVMQKGKELKWQCTGIECRVAGEDQDITNIARGGVAKSLEETLHECGLETSAEHVKSQMVHLCKYFCEVMDQEGHYGEFGMDIGLDHNGYPWLIEANVFPSFKGFKLMDYDTYLHIRKQPIEYAVSLQGFSVVEEIDDESSDETFDYDIE